jgi:hypothetical protein
MRLNGKIAALLRGAGGWLASKASAIWNYSVDPPQRHLKFYFWIVLAVSVAGYFLWAPLFGGIKRVASPAPITIPAADRFAMLPLANIPECTNAGEVEKLRTLLFDMTETAKGKAERVLVLEAEVAKLKAEAGKDVGTWRRKRKPVSTSAREDLRETLAR